MTERCRIVFTDAAIKECARVGHDWHWEQQSGDRGFMECYRCGDTQRHMVSHKDYLAAGPEDLARLGEGRAPSSSPEPDPPPVSIDPPPAAPPRRRRASRDNEERDAEILAEHFAGEKPTAIGKRRGLTAAQVRRIVAQHTRGEQRRSST